MDIKKVRLGRTELWVTKTAFGALPVQRVSTEEYGAKAPRPKNSRMSKDKLTQQGFTRLPAWQDALKRYLKEIGN